MSPYLPGVALPVLIAVAVASCAPTGTSLPQQGRGERQPAVQRTLVAAIRGEVPSVASKPLVPVSGALAPPVTLFNATLDFVDERGTAHPFLAEALPKADTDAWRVLPDGRMETTYRLKPGLYWQDGTPLSSEDFIFAWRVYSTPEFGVSTVPPIGLMEGLVAPDARTLTIRWRQTYGDAAVMQGDFQPLPEHILGDPFRSLSGADPLAFSALPFWTHEYIGLGPYQVVAWEPGAFIDGAAFDGYVFGRPRIDRVRLQFFSDPNAAMAGLLSGQVHFVGDFILSGVEGETLEEQWASNHEGRVLYATGELRVSVIQLRPEHADPPALLDVRVRQALAHAIDASTAVDLLTAGKGLTTSTLSSPAVDYYSEIERVISKYPFDPRAAQQLLDRAGFTKPPSGFFADSSGRTLSLGVWSSNGPKNERENAIYVDSMRRVGFDATSKTLPAHQLRDAQARALIPGLGIRGFGHKRFESFTIDQITRPENRWQGDNRGGWANAEYDQLFAAYSKMLDSRQRIRQIALMERVFSDEVPGIPHFFNTIVNAHVAELHGPVARTIPEAGVGYLHVHQWEWRS